MDKYDKILKLWKRMNITDDSELGQALNNFSIAFAYNSYKIENDLITYNDIREVFECDGVTSYTGDLRTLFEIRNAKKAYDFFLASFNRRKALDEHFILELHSILTENTYDTRRWQFGERPGSYKKHDYVTGREEVGAAPDEVKEEMNELLEEISNISDEQALLGAAYLHVKFENIHPFADGNGRCGRLAMNYLLVLHNHPPVVIYEEDRKAYYGALEAWDKHQDLNSMCDFLKYQTVKTWTRQLERDERKKYRNMER